MDLMTPSGGTIFYATITFVLLLIVLRKVAWKPILATLDERERRIRQSLEQADAARAEAEKTLAGQAEILTGAKKEAQEIVAQSRAAAETAREEILSRARNEAEKMTQAAVREIAQSRDKALEEIRDLAVELSMTATEKLIGKSLSREEHGALIDLNLKRMEGSN